MTVAFQAVGGEEARGIWGYFNCWECRIAFGRTVVVRGYFRKFGDGLRQIPSVENNVRLIVCFFVESQ